ncbi:hypothetical protein NE237_009437 [Protea cynaroides]|uniref:NAD(P)-binding domain-containing protein n=1 Tax=Protea cynaroides TaxID=273540 RepID=A0A9Q0R0M7_9MAGN|nr:hypothetical protein NE237_009437 [Protea cynaroides]
MEIHHLLLQLEDVNIITDEAIVANQWKRYTTTSYIIIYMYQRKLVKQPCFLPLEPEGQKSLISHGIFIVEDLNDARSLAKLFDVVVFTHVKHLAAQAGVRYAMENPSSYVHNNVAGLLTVRSLQIDKPSTDGGLGIIEWGYDWVKIPEERSAEASAPLGDEAIPVSEDPDQPSLEGDEARLEEGEAALKTRHKRKSTASGEPWKKRKSTADKGKGLATLDVPPSSTPSSQALKPQQQLVFKI